jgi:ABC-2 type transport system permease protein
MKGPSMLNQICALTIKDLKIFVKDPAALILTFLQPLMFILIMSYALSGLYGGGDRPIRFLIVNQDQGRQAAAVIKDMQTIKSFALETTWKDAPLSRQSAERLIIEGKRNLAVIFPADFSAALEQGPGMQERRTAKVIVIADPALSSQFVDPIMGTLNGFIERRSFMAMVPKGIDYLYEASSPVKPRNDRDAFKAQAERAMEGGLSGKENKPVTLEQVSPPGMHVEKRPNAFQQNVPGYTIYGIFWIVSLLAGSVLRERREGTFRRLLIAPMGRAVMLIGKLLPFYMINLMQLIFIFALSKLLFGMTFGHSVAGVVAVSLAVSACATGLGIFVAAVARTEAQLGGLTVLLLLGLSALGGCFVPRFVMPSWLKAVGLATPHAWALDAYQDLLVRGYGFAEVLPKVGVLAAFAVLFFVIGVWRFRFE